MIDFEKAVLQRREPTEYSLMDKRDNWTLQNSEFSSTQQMMQLIILHFSGQEKVETTPPDSCQRSKDKSAAFLSVGNTYWNAYFRHIHIFNQIQMLKPKRKEYVKSSAWKLATTQLTSLSFFEKHSNL